MRSWRRKSWLWIMWGNERQGRHRRGNSSTRNHVSTYFVSAVSSVTSSGNRIRYTIQQVLWILAISAGEASLIVKGTLRLRFMYPADRLRKDLLNYSYQSMTATVSAERRHQSFNYTFDTRPRERPLLHRTVDPSVESRSFS